MLFIPWLLIFAYIIEYKVLHYSLPKTYIKTKSYFLPWNIQINSGMGQGEVYKTEHITSSVYNINASWKRGFFNFPRNHYDIQQNFAKICTLLCVTNKSFLTSFTCLPALFFCLLVICKHHLCELENKTPRFI